jgi:hypothetical protein
LRHALAGSILEGDESLEERKESLGDLLRDLLPAEDQVEDVLDEIIRQWDALQVWRNLDFRLSSSVVDPYPYDPTYVFGPPGSFDHQAKIVRKTLISTVL